MSEEASIPVAAPTPAPADASTEQAVPGPESKEPEIANGTGSNAAEETSASKEGATDATAVEASAKVANDDKQTSAEGVTQNESSTKDEDVEMKDATPAGEAVPKPVESAEPAVGTPACAAKPKAPRRKSAGVPEHKTKKLGKKASMAKISHTDAKPGDFYFVRLKGYPLWPGIICEEEMLPNTITKTRPNGAANAEGAYKEGYEEGGPKAKDRQFPVMYLYTNEFGWVHHTDLVDIDWEKISENPTSMRKDLAGARLLAAERHDIQYFKDVLREHQEVKDAAAAAKAAAKAEKKEKSKSASAKKVKKEKSAKLVGDDEDEDVSMADAMGDPESDDGSVSGSANSNKRKAEDTPQRSDVKKPRQTIKLNTGKTPNGTSTPKPAKDATPKSAKAKVKKAAKAAQKPEVPKEPELSPEEKRKKKEKEILFLRHKLQKGLLTRDQAPKEAEMKAMSEFVSKLEGYADLEVSIIRATKINKVLKAILKLPSIPKEDEFQFKTRSQSLLDKWNQLLATEQSEAGTTVSANGTAAESKIESEDAKHSPKEEANGNGIKESSAEEKDGSKAEVKTSEAEPAESAADPAAVSKDTPV